MHEGSCCRKRGRREPTRTPPGGQKSTTRTESCFSGGLARASHLAPTACLVVLCRNDVFHCRHGYGAPTPRRSRRRSCFTEGNRRLASGGSGHGGFCPVITQYVSWQAVAGAIGPRGAVGRRNDRAPRLDRGGVRPRHGRTLREGCGPVNGPVTNASAPSRVGGGAGGGGASGGGSWRGRPCGAFCGSRLGRRHPAASAGRER